MNHGDLLDEPHSLLYEPGYYQEERTTEHPHLFKHNEKLRGRERTLIKI